MDFLAVPAEEDQRLCFERWLLRRRRGCNYRIRRCRGTGEIEILKFYHFIPHYHLPAFTCRKGRERLWESLSKDHHQPFPESDIAPGVAESELWNGKWARRHFLDPQTWQNLCPYLPSFELNSWILWQPALLRNGFINKIRSLSVNLQRKIKSQRNLKVRAR